MNAQKKQYLKPSMRVVMVKQRHLLLGSVQSSRQSYGEATTEEWG